MSEMVERVAQAIKTRALERGSDPIHPAVLHHLAAAAIEAMREPTQKMCTAGSRDYEDGVNGADAGGIWKAMIDAALMTNV